MRNKTFAIMGTTGHIGQFLTEAIYKTINEEKISATQDITAEYFGKTTIEEFARILFAQEMAR